MGIDENDMANQMETNDEKMGLNKIEKLQIPELD